MYGIRRQENMYLITASLLNSWQGFVEKEYINKEQFISTLKREQTPTTEAQEKGYKFEEWAGENIPCLVGAAKQVKVYKRIEGYFLYGIIDFLKCGVVYDAKYTSNYDVGKFLNSTQTSMYLELVPEALQMVYVVSTKVNPEPYEIYYEKYDRQETIPIKFLIDQFQEWLNNYPEYNDLYKKYWKTA